MVLHRNCKRYLGNYVCIEFVYYYGYVPYMYCTTVIYIINNNNGKV